MVAGSPVNRTGALSPNGRLPLPDCGSTSYSLTNSTVSVVVEVKTSRSDFLADRKKAHRVEGGMGTYRYFLCPTDVIRVDELPQGWGLLYVNERGHIKPMAGPVTLANGNYYDYQAALEAWKQTPDTVREQWLLIKLLSQVGDPEQMNRERKDVWRELNAVRDQHNRVLKERDEAHVRNRELSRELRAYQRGDTEAVTAIARAKAVRTTTSADYELSSC